MEIAGLLGIGISPRHQVSKVIGTAQAIITRRLSTAAT
jgi:hypothetical protein